MKNVEPLLNKLLDVFEVLLPEDDKIFEIIVDETLWPRLNGSLEKAIVIEPKNSHWKRGEKMIPICTLDYISVGRKPTILLKSQKGVILSWPIPD